MRRLLVLLLLLPAAARAQTSGQVLFDGGNTTVINRAACETGTTRLDYLLAEQSVGVFVANTGEVDIYAASADKTETGFPPCHFEGDGSTGVTIGAILATPMTNPTSRSGYATGSTSFLAAKAGFNCTDADKTIYVCVVWKDANAAVKAYAKGSVSLRVVAPDAPVVADVQPGGGALSVWVKTTATQVSSVAAATFRARAVDASGAEHFSDPVAADGTNPVKARIDGLTNGVPYTVTAFAYSDDDNESPESSPWGEAVVPQPVQDAWQHYQAAGGRDSGGCGSGPAGLVALVGAAALLRLRRRP